MDWDKGTSYSGPIQNFERRQPVQETTLKSEVIQIERKTISILLKENPHGRFLRITEQVDGRYNSIVIPATGLEEFKKVVSEIAELSITRGPGR